MAHDYQTYATVPAYAPLVLDEQRMPMRDPEARLRWGGHSPPPRIGSTVYCRINNLGYATVTGYFSEQGYLGILVRFLDAPEWHRKQRNNDPTGHLFGTEFQVTSVPVEAS